MTVNFQRLAFNLTANGAQFFQVTGSQVIIESSTGPLEIRSSSGDILGGRLAGQGFATVGGDFSNLTLTDQSGAPNSGYLVVSDGQVIDRRITGSVQFAPLNTSFTNAQRTVTNADSQLIAANPNRKYLLVQNNSTSGDIYVTVDGSAATTANGVRLAANGGSLEYANVVPSGAVRAIGTQANNPNVVTIEG